MSGRRVSHFGALMPEQTGGPKQEFETPGLS